MGKKNIKLSAALVILVTASTVSITQAMGSSYGQRPMQGGQYPQGQSKDQRKDQKRQIKRQQKMNFYRQNPRATDKDWEQYWDNYKRQNGLKKRQNGLKD